MSSIWTGRIRWQPAPAQSPRSIPEWISRIPVLRDALTAGWDFVHNWPVGQEQADVNQETTPILDQETTPILDQETTPILDGGTAVILQQETTPILDQETTPILDGKKYPAYGHGTMVAGLIHLVAPDAKIMPLRAFGADGSATISQIVQAIYFAVDHGANVINMSFSVKQDSPSLKAALDYAASKGVICVASAGNDGQVDRRVAGRLQQRDRRGRPPTIWVSAASFPISETRW